MTMQDFTVEEYKTAVGCLMEDLRGSWAANYYDRMDTLLCMLRELVDIDPENVKEYENDIEVTCDEMNDPYDGRVFRDRCRMYAYKSEEGMTLRVQQFLQSECEFPKEFIWHQ